MHIGDKVRVCEPLRYLNDAHVWQDREGRVTYIYKGGRAANVVLDDDPEKDHVWFAVRELQILD